MKNIIYIAIAFLVLFSGCDNCEELILSPCANNDVDENTERCGMTVATCYSRLGSGAVGVIYDTRFNSSAIPGTDWGISLTGFYPSNWFLDSIGQVFGIAIDADENIYLAASDIYVDAGTFTGFPSGNPNRPPQYGSAQIFKCVPPSYDAVPFVNLPNSGDPLNGIGNIAYDKWNNQLFATNLEDGKIYRIDMGGTVIETYDPGLVDVPAPGIVIQGERIWGIGVNNEGGQVKIYYPKIDGAARRIYSLTLNGDAFPPANSEIIEIANVRGSQNIVSDIAFSNNNQEMLVAERSDPHTATVVSYSLSSLWALNLQYYAGSSAGNNSAGGVDFAYTEVNENVSHACDEFFWVSANSMTASSFTMGGAMYGLEGISYQGNNSQSSLPNPNSQTDLFIDFDGDYTTEDKRTIGDVEVIDCIRCGDPCDLSDYSK